MISDKTAEDILVKGPVPRLRLLEIELLIPDNKKLVFTSMFLGTFGILKNCFTLG